MFKWMTMAALGLLLPVAAGAADKKLSPADYEEIHGLYAKYAFGFDNGDSKLVAMITWGSFSMLRSPG